ncbi:MAG: hypothetical protein CVT89_09100 [Candidatus Altiarchaeales archaeon HGW-Altiarchaeales-2]|nr:MAG: hypothetical protein CVT89_09100 [Candidatus Altiarchaeales archaeon HGW-Altiarchaeales-2]
MKICENLKYLEICLIKTGNIWLRVIILLLHFCLPQGCFADGETKIFNAERLRLKESDRLKAITQELRKMNADIEETKDGLIIRKSDLKGAEINPHNDHRIAMSCAIAGLSAEGKTVINDAECVNKSYPSFFEDIGRCFHTT